MLRTNAFRLLLVFALLGCAAPASHAQVNGCKAYQEPDVTIEQLVIMPRYNDTLDLTSMRALASEGGPTIVSPRHETPVGLTSASLRFDSRYEVLLTTTPEDGMVCGQIASMNISFGFGDTTIYIAKEIPQGSCSYQAVMQHELLHVKTDEAIVATTAPLLPSLLRKALNEIGVVRASSSEAAEEHLKTMIDAYMKTLGSNLSKVRQDRQALIDTEQEYDRISNSCDGALGELIATANARRY